MTVNSTTHPASDGEEVTRTEVRPGLVMVKRRTLKEDGRYLLYFDFERKAENRDPSSSDSGNV